MDILSLKKLAQLGAHNKPLEISSVEFACHMDTSPQTAARKLKSLEDEMLITRQILHEFANKNIDLTKIESRPTKKLLGDYLFHIDLKGHIEDRIIMETLEKIKSKVGMLKILGSYPAAR